MLWRKRRRVKRKGYEVECFFSPVFWVGCSEDEVTFEKRHKEAERGCRPDGT